MDYDIIIIGSGPAGYTGAIRAAQLGFKVACIEKEPSLGGTCLNVGCIPSKALLESSEKYEETKHSLSSHGINCGEVSLDLSKLLARKDKIVKTLTMGVASLFKKNQVTWLKGIGRIENSNTVLLTQNDGTNSTITAKNIIIATGSTVAIPRIFTVDNQYIVTSTEALSFSTIPKHLVIIGAGVIGLELGSVWKRLGAKVTLIELLPRILNGMDTEISSMAQKSLTKQGLNFILGAKVTSANIVTSSESTDNIEKEVEVSYEMPDGSSNIIKCDKVMICVGRKPNTENLGAKEAGISLDTQGRIDITEHFETSLKGVYAVGDVVKGAMLAHKAEEEAIAVVEYLAGKYSHVNYKNIPAVVYTHPEIASVGATEDELKQSNIEYKKGTFPFIANSRAKAMGATDGMVKILSDSKTDQILGAHIFGPLAGELISEIVSVIEFGGSSEDIFRTCHSHPTLSEAVKEAALSVHSRTINF